MDTQGHAEFYDFTRRLLIDAANKRDGAMLRRAEIRINGDRFMALSESRQEDLLLQLGAAQMACGVVAAKMTTEPQSNLPWSEQFCSRKPRRRFCRNE